MKILLTGGTGFIGSHFLNQALLAGHEVMALRRSPASKPKITLIEQPQWIDAQLDQVSADQLIGSDVLVHLAAHSVQYPFDTLASCLRWNLIAALGLFEQARLAGIQSYIVAGSCFEYGESGLRYQRIPVTAPLAPTNSYAASKAAASICLTQWANEHKLGLEILRVFHVFGEGEHESRLWPSLRRAALMGENFPMTLGEQVRDFIPVEELAKIFLERAESVRYNNQQIAIKNIGSNKSQTVRQFCEFWWSYWQASGDLEVGALPDRDGEILRYVPELE